MRPNIAVIGSSNWDMSMKVPLLPSPGETVTGGSCSFCLGGKGANQAVAAARAGGDVFFLSCVGTDSVADEVKNELKANEIGLHGIISVAGTETGKAMIFVAEDGENSIGVADGANARLNPDLLIQYANKIGEADTVLLQMEIPFSTVSAAARMANNMHTKVILNPAPALNFNKEILPFVSILTPNQMEMAKICGVNYGSDSDLIIAAQSLLEQGLEAVIITLGEAGVFVIGEQEEFKMPAFKVKVEDTTAAGDVFNGALAVALVLEATMREAVEFAMAAAALSVQKPGAIPSIPCHEQIEAFIKNEKA